MASLGCGYDEDFVDTPVEYLKCIVCHLVLRDPVQLMECGHHYCCGCFEKIKGYAAHFHSELSCPIDRQVIDLNKVLKDRFMERMVADLQVRCSFKDEGCAWVGELRNIEAHRNECVHAVKEHLELSQCSASEVGGTTEMLKQILFRLEKCEEALHEKEKDLAYVKYHQKETKEKLDKRDEEVELLKQRVLNGEQIAKLRDDDVKLLFEELKLQNEDTMTLKNEFEELRRKIKQGIKQGITDRIVSNKQEIADPKKSFEVHDNAVKLNVEQMAKLRDEDVMVLKNKIDELQRKKIESENESIIHDQGINDRIVSNKEEIADLKKSFEVQDNVMHGFREEITKVKKTVEEKEKKNLKCDQSGPSGLNNGSIIKQNNLLMWSQTYSNNDQFVWGAPVKVNVVARSPTFYCCCVGYPWRLGVLLEFDRQISLGLNRLGDENHVYKDLTLDIDIELVNRDVTKEEKNVCSKKIEYKSDDNYGIYLCYINEDVYRNFISNDILTISFKWKCHHS